MSIADLYFKDEVNENVNDFKTNTWMFLVLGTAGWQMLIHLQTLTQSVGKIHIN